MIALETIHQMPLREKLFIMEALWEELRHDESSVEVPQWHKDLLDERERLLAEEKTRFIPWEEAKKQIREATR